MFGFTFIYIVRRLHNYPSILGAVLVGIGVALLIQNKSESGLSLAGAVAINLCGGIVLAFWLSFGFLALPTRGLKVMIRE